AELAEGARRARADGRHVGIDAVGEAEIVRPRHAPALHRPGERAAIVHAVGGQRVLIALVGPGAHLEHQRGVGYRAGHRPRVREAPRAAGRVYRHAAQRRLEADDAPAGGRDADRAAAVGADVQRAHAGGGGRRGAAAGTAWRAIEIPRIARDAVEEIVGGPDPAKRRRVRLAEHDAAGRLHA